MFRTEINISPSQFKMELKDPIVTIGSCFSDTMGACFQANKFDVLKNPFGTVYNPLSIFKLLEYGLLKEYPSTASYIENDGLYANYHFHSSFSSIDQSDLITLVEESIENAHSFLQKAKFLIITFGTAYVYRTIKTNEIVANCHKIPAKNFTKHLLTQKQILSGFGSFFDSLNKVNPSVQIILTVSPVRHLKDTISLNSVSKSTLRLACHTLTEQYENVVYFPSYELLLDDLRDYRFYKEDMIHPTTQAEEYIWNKFQETYFSESTKQFIKEWSKISSAIKHRPFNPSSKKHQDFLKQTIQKIESLDSSLDFSEELTVLKKQLA